MPNHPRSRKPVIKSLDPTTSGPPMKPQPPTVRPGSEAGGKKQDPMASPVAASSTKPDQGKKLR